MTLASLITSVRNYLESQYMYANDEWLYGCVEYLSSNGYQGEELYNVAKEQWLLNDLKEICPGCLPANLNAKLKTILNGHFVLQINSAFDIGTPAYQQYMALQKVNMENIEATTNHKEKIPCHRMIKIHLTDGVQDIIAIEYKPMRSLSCEIIPGCKVLIKGPIECRRGMLLLMDGRIEILGGDVQDIVISNSLAGLLSMKLGLPVTQIVQDNSGGLHNAGIPKDEVLQNDIQYQSEAMIDQNSRPVARVTCLQAHNNEYINPVINNDNVFKRSSNDNHMVPQKRPKMDTPIINNVDYPDDSELQELQYNLRQEPNINTDTDNNDDNLFPEEDEEYLREMEDFLDAKEYESLNLSTGSKQLPCEPYVYIKQINELKDGEKNGKVYRVKGQIMKLLSKLSVGKDGWSLKCTIVDGTGSADVEFTSDVLSKLVGFTPFEMNEIKKQMVLKPELKDKAVSALQKAKESLQILYCIIELTDRDGWKITSLIPFDESHANQQRKRMQDR